ncbi:DEAD/DEAH box helicase [Cohnella lubricantis]|uniref:DEAD/DEAH box helicase n=1 Tax=Cohnella lubricantis TaxID=2163172 RepID=A0A841TG40_9BACL|nr:DEAD/DEAH box helicase [Cohnella lubricantis]MBB6677431.1 DEAD/DEAH box helicase [Cohnella lubricantis]MBP2117521.1 SNF2 family DNA or RNA helicase [Cohnella lubricantis]
MKAFETTTELMQHQVDAVNKSLPSRINALLMDPGTGKSRTIIELVKYRHKKIDRVVWFCPVSLKLTVRGEILKHTYCSAEDICVFDDKITGGNIPEAMWYVVGIESMSQSARELFAAHQLITDRTMAILDESQYCKNNYALRAIRIINLCRDTRYRAIMTGTLLSNGIKDMFSQFYFLSPKILGYQSFWSFAANHIEYSDKYPGQVVRAHNVEYLAAKIKPYTYQITKEECLNLPGRMYKTAYFDMTDEQRFYYDSIKNDYLDLADTATFDRYIIFRMFSALQQVVCGYHNRKGRVIHLNHRRLQTLMDSIQREPDNEKIIVWAKYQRDIEMISTELKTAYGDDQVAVYYGKVAPKNRKSEEERFKSSARFFVATAATGGHGLTLVESHIVKVYNRTFKYAENEQMEDRVCRIGQMKKAMFEDIHCVQSIDDRIWKSICRKGDIVQDFRAEVEKVKKERLKELIKAL